MNDYAMARSDIPVRYTIKLNAIADMPGFMVEIADKINRKNYTLSGVYLKRESAISDADIFINDLFEEESMLIN